MIALFPDGLDLQNLQVSRADYNSQTTERRFTHDTLLYIISELEKKVGADNSEDTTSLDYKVNNRRSGTQLVSPGINTIEFREVATAVYLINAYLILSGSEHLGEIGVVIPQVSPIVDAYGNDSRTTTSFDISCSDSGTLYWEIKPYET